jgi:hypothetical protein
MTVTISLMAQLKAAAARSSCTVAIAEGATMADLASAAAVQLSPAVRAILFDDRGDVRSGVLAFCGAQQVDWTAPVESAEITFISAISGG